MATFPTSNSFDLEGIDPMLLDGYQLDLGQSMFDIEGFDVSELDTYFDVGAELDRQDVSAFNDDLFVESGQRNMEQEQNIVEEQMSNSLPSTNNMTQSAGSQSPQELAFNSGEHTPPSDVSMATSQPSVENKDPPTTEPTDEPQPTVELSEKARGKQPANNQLMTPPDEHEIELALAQMHLSEQYECIYALRKSMNKLISEIIKSHEYVPHLEYYGLFAFQNMHGTGKDDILHQGLIAGNDNILKHTGVADKHLAQISLRLLSQRASFVNEPVGSVHYMFTVQTIACDTKTSIMRDPGSGKHVLQELFVDISIPYQHGKADNSRAKYPGTKRVHKDQVVSMHRLRDMSWSDMQQILQFAASLHFGPAGQKGPRTMGVLRHVDWPGILEEVFYFRLHIRSLSPDGKPVVTNMISWYNMETFK